MENRFFNEIRQLPEKGDIEHVLKKWEAIQKRKWIPQMGEPLVIPEILMYCAPGIGKSHLLKLLSDGLQESQVMEFSGEVPFFEFVFEYCHPQERFGELSRFQAGIVQAAGFRSNFKGIICIELDEWLDHVGEKYFNVFFEFLEELSDNVLLIFSVSRGTEAEKKAMEQYLSMAFRLEVVHLTMPTAPEYSSYIVSFLEKYGFAVTKEVEDMLVASIDELRGNPYFDGYKSIRRMLQDIVYHVLTLEEENNTVLTEAMLSKFRVDGEYILQTKQIYKKKEIGF